MGECSSENLPFYYPLDTAKMISLIILTTTNSASTCHVGPMRDLPSWAVESEITLTSCYTNGDETWRPGRPGTKPVADVSAFGKIMGQGVKPLYFDDLIAANNGTGYSSTVSLIHDNPNLVKEYYDGYLTECMNVCYRRQDCSGAWAFLRYQASSYDTDNYYKVIKKFLERSQTAKVYFYCGLTGYFDKKGELNYNHGKYWNRTQYGLIGEEGEVVGEGNMYASHVWFKEQNPNWPECEASTCFPGNFKALTLGDIIPPGYDLATADEVKENLDEASKALLRTGSHYARLAGHGSLSANEGTESVVKTNGGGYGIEIVIVRCQYGDGTQN